MTSRWLLASSVLVLATACGAPHGRLAGEMTYEGPEPIEGGEELGAGLAPDAAALLARGDARFERGEPIAARESWSRAAAIDTTVAPAAEARIAACRSLGGAPATFGALAPLWKSELGPKRRGLVDARGGFVLVSHDGRRVRALDASTGKAVGWAESPIELATVGVGEGRAILFDARGRASFFDADLSRPRGLVDVAALAKESGEPLERRRERPTALAVADGALFVARVEGDVLWTGAVDLHTRALRCERRDYGAGIERVALAASEGVVVCLALDELVAYDTDGLRPRWRRRTFFHEGWSTHWSPPPAIPRVVGLAVHGDRVLVRYSSGHLESISIADGRRVELFESADLARGGRALLRGRELLVHVDRALRVLSSPFARELAPRRSVAIETGSSPSETALFDLGDVVVAATPSEIQAFSTRERS